jgi:hypothetical protein
MRVLINDQWHDADQAVIDELNKLVMQLEAERIKHKEIRDAGAKLRRLQDAYFKSRDSMNLKAAKVMEEKFDAMLGGISKAEQAFQSQLFR